MVIPTDQMHIFPFFFSQDLLMYVNLIYIKIIGIIDTNGYYICCLSEFFSIYLDDGDDHEDMQVTCQM